MLLFLLPFILIFGGFLFSAYIISLLKLPLAIISAVLAFIYLPGLLEKRLDVSRNYSLALGGLLSGAVALIVYSLPLFWIVIVVGLLVVVNGFLYMYTGVNMYTELKNLIKGTEGEMRRQAKKWKKRR